MLLNEEERRLPVRAFVTSLLTNAHLRPSEVEMVAISAEVSLADSDHGLELKLPVSRAAN